MFNVYIEREIFEDICLFDDYPNWKEIFSNQTQVLLNMSDDELENELSDPESPIFLFQDVNAGAKIPIALKSQFQSIKEDIANVINHPRDAFIFDIEPEEAQTAMNNFGIAVFSTKDLSDTFFKGGLFKELNLNQNIPGGWKSLVSMDLPASNSLIISDDFLFQNEEGNQNCGLGNLPSLIDAFLPAHLETEYHISIIAPSAGKSREWWIKKFGALKNTINKLRDYDIKLELIFTHTIHKRRIISNYINGWADKGFSIFRNSNPEQVRGVNDLHIYRVFDNIGNKGITHFDSASNGLAEIKEKCRNVVEYIRVQGESEYAMVFGDCNKNKSTINRLLNF